MTLREDSPAGVPRESSSESDLDSELCCPPLLSWSTSSESNDEVPAAPVIPADVPILLRKDITKGSLLGSGGFGEAYKGSLRLSDGTEATVAIKEFLAPNSMKKVLQEACMLRDVAGIAGAPRLYGVIAEEESLTLVMEFCQGRSFCDFVREANSADASLAMQLIEKAVEDLHQAGFAHCDLHGSNIMVDNTSSALSIRFIDFGLAERFSNCKRDDESGKRMDKKCLKRLAFSIPKQDVFSHIF